MSQASLTLAWYAWKVLAAPPFSAFPPLDTETILLVMQVSVTCVRPITPYYVSATLPLTGPPAPATLPGRAPDFSFQNEEVVLVPELVAELVWLVRSGIAAGTAGLQLALSSCCWPCLLSCSRTM